MRPLRTLLPLAALLVSACSSGPQGPPPGRGGPPGGGPGGAHAGPPPEGGPDGPRGGPAMLFVSPAGEPFRAPAGAPYPVAAWFEGADRNGDHKLDRQEFLADAMRFFAVLDRNHDDLIDGPEVRVYETVIVPEILRGAQMGAAETPLILAYYQMPDMGGMGGGQGGGMGGGMGGPPGGGGGPPGGGRGRSGGGPGGGQNMSGAAPYGLLREPEPVAASGLSFGGRISSDDFRRRNTQRFDLLDADKDGYLDLATLPKTAVQTMGPGGGGRRRRS